MKKIFILLSVILCLVLPSVSAVQIFFDDFESGTLPSTGWTLTSASGANNWTNSTVNPFQGLRHAQAAPGSTKEPASVMQRTISTSGYQNINFSYSRRLIALDIADEFQVEWFNGTNWTILEQTGSAAANDASYLNKSFLLSVAANNNANFAIKFECTASVSEFCRVDNVNITGNVISDTTPPIVRLLNPINNTFVNNQLAFFSANISDDIALANATLHIWNSSSLVGTNFTALSGTNALVNRSFTLPRDGTYLWNYLTYDSSGNNAWNNTNFTFILDSVQPAINVVYPLNISYSSVQTIINYSVSDANLQACWYSLNNGASNITITCGQNVTGLNSGQGTSTWKVYANDSAGNVNSSSVTFFVDSILPLINFVSPSEINGTTITRNNILINVTASDVNLGNITIRLYNSSLNLIRINTTTSNNLFVNYSNFGDGTYYFNATAVDILNNENNTETRTVTIDATPPFVSIISPQNISYNNATILVNITSDGANIWFFNGTGNESYNVPVLRTFSQGSNALIAYANDSAGNLNTTSVTFSIDSILPLIQFVSPTENSGSLLARNNILVNVTASDNNLANITIRLFNSTRNLIQENVSATSPFFINYSSLNDGVYFFNASVIDNVNNQNSTETRNVSIDTKSPNVFDLRPIAGTNYSSSVTIEVAANVSDVNNVGAVIAQINYPNSTILNLSLINTLGQKYNASFTIPLLMGRYNITFIANDSAGNVNSSERTHFFAVDNEFPKYANATQTPASPVIYSSGQVYRFNITWTDNIAISNALIEFNGVNYSMTNNGNVYSRTFNDLSAGNYSFYYWANDTSGNSNQTGSAIYSIVKANGTISLRLNSTEGNINLSYGGLVNASASSNTSTIQLLRNGIDVTGENNQFVLLGAGYYNYTALALENQNYTRASIERFVNISKGEDNVTLLINGTAGNQTGIYGVQTNVSASSLYGSITLYRNGINATSQNNIFVTLAAGDYNYTAVSSGNENFTGISITRWSHISKAQGNTSLLLNNTAGNITIAYPGQINASATSSTGAINLYRDGININPENHLFKLFGVGYYNYTATANESENYTLATITRFANVTKAVNNVILLLNGNSNNLTIGYPQQSNITAFADFGNAIIYKDGIDISGENGLNLTRAAGYYNITAVSSGNQNYSSDSKTLFLNITKANSLLNISISPSSSVVYPKETNATGTGCANEVTCILYRNNFSVNNPDIQTLGAGSYNYIYNTTGNQNYTSASSSINLVVSQGAGVVYTFVNNLRANITIQTGTNIYLNGTLINGTGIIKLYNNGSLINQGINTIINLTNFSTSGIYNITTIYDGNENYTGAFETWFVDVTDAPDTTPPLVTGLIPLANSNFSLGSSIEIAANVTDNVAVSSVFANITMPNGTINQINLANNNGKYNASYLLGLIGRHNVTFIANDTSNNVNSSEGTFFNAQGDTIPPLISITYPINTNYTIIVTEINYSVSDNSGLSSCWFTNNSGITNITISCNNGSNTFSTNSGQGTSTWKVYANDTNGNENSSSVTFFVDSLSPTVTINVPGEGSVFGFNESINLNYSASDTNIASCWYSLDASVNVSLPNCANTTFNTTEGSHTIRVYANDSLGNEGFDSNGFSVVLGAPTIELVSPNNNSYLNYTSIVFNYSASDTDLSSCSLLGDFTGTFAVNQTNTTVVSGQASAFYLTLNEGSYLWGVGCNDTQGNSAFAGNRSLFIDLTSASMQIFEPNGSYNSLNNVPLIFSVSDASPLTCIYNVSSVIGNTIIPNCLNTTFNVNSEGNYTLYLFVNDNAGNSNSSSSNFSVDLPEPPIAETHLECIDKTCTLVQGAGENECSEIGESCGGGSGGSLPPAPPPIVNETEETACLDENNNGICDNEEVPQNATQGFNLGSFITGLFTAPIAGGEISTGDLIIILVIAAFVIYLIIVILKASKKKETTESIKSRLSGIIGAIKRKFRRKTGKHHEGIMIIDRHFIDKLKEHAKGKDYGGKWIRVS